MIRSSRLDAPRVTKVLRVPAAMRMLTGLRMRVSLYVLTALGLTAALPSLADAAGGATGAVGSVSGADVFANHCAVCHGPQAAGIPGSFPPLHEQVVAFAKAAPGRDYLIMVVTTGLMGGLKVGGVGYNGVMPAQSGLSEAEVAAVLNFLAGDLGKNDLGTAALSAAEVSDVRARHPEKSPQATRALRPATEP